MQVEIWSDIACPWCFVGKRRFEAALADFEHRDEVRVRWRSFELDPGAPPEREGERASHLAEKYGVSREEADAMQRNMAETARREGLDFRFEDARGGNMFDAHRLLHMGAEHGLQDALKERLLRAYLCEGELMSDRETLVRLAGEAGLAADGAREVLETGRYAAEVREDERAAAALGITAVPFFVIDRTFGVSGAHPSEALLEVLREAWSAGSPLSVVDAGDSCGVDGC